MSCNIIIEQENKVLKNQVNQLKVHNGILKKEIRELSEQLNMETRGCTKKKKGLMRKININLNSILICVALVLGTTSVCLYIGELLGLLTVSKDTYICLLLWFYAIVYWEMILSWAKLIKK